MRFLFSVWTLTLIPALLAAGSSRADESERATTESGSELSWLADKTELRTFPLLPTLKIPGDVDADGISALTIRLSKLTPQGGTAEFVVDRSEVEFNEFGDAERVAPDRISTYPVQLERIHVADALGEGRCLFAIRFEGKAHVNRFYLVLSPGPITRDRLLIAAGDATPPALRTSIVEMGSRPELMELKFQEIISLESVGERQWIESFDRGDSLGLVSGSFQLPGLQVTQDGRPVRVEAYGRRDEQLRLGFDPNLLTRGPFGDVVVTTLMAYSHAPYDLRRRPLEDPAQKGRFIFDLLPAEDDKQQPFPVTRPNARLQFTLVTSPMGDDSDRLLIRTNGKLTHVTPLVDRERSRVLRLQQELAGAPLDWEVTEQVRSLIGFYPMVTAEDGHVRRLQLSGETIRPDVLQLLGALSGLRVLTLSEHPRYDSGETPLSLQHLSQLTHLHFRNIPIDDAVLQEVAHLRKLGYLRIELDSVQESSTVRGLQITDEGLKSIATLSELTHLRLQGSGITDAGVEHLLPLPGLKRLELYQTSATPKGLAAFVSENSAQDISLQTSRRDVAPHEEPQYLSVSIDQSQMSAVLNGTLATDEQLAALSGITNLRSLRIESPVITNEGLLRVSELRDLETLSVRRNPLVTAAALKILRSLPRLRTLSLNGCEGIDDRIVDVLAPFTELRELDLHRTKVSEQGFTELRSDLLNCKVLPERRGR